MNHVLRREQTACDKRRILGGVIAGALLALSALVAQAGAPPASPLPGLTYDVPFFPGAEYDPAVPTPDQILGFPIGTNAMTVAQVQAIAEALAKSSPRVRLFEYARSHEGRALHYLVVSSEENIRQLDQLKTEFAELADPRTVSASDGDRLADKLPAVAWMAYSIHGDEMSGTDASLALAYHLAASTDESVKKLLSELIVIIDPLMNPDGRERCLRNIAENRTAQPDVDDQSLLHFDLWPGGRTNHYLFDMNRDWIYGTQPETRGRIAAFNAWHPHYMMESHEMWSQATFLFLPPGEPVNPNMPPHVLKWLDVFARDHAAAFDRLGWRYYTGEWNEEWYPGYSSTWGALHNAIEQLYEQARIIVDGVRRAEGTIETYREAVHHQLVSSMANLETLGANRKAVLHDFLTARRRNVAADGPYGQRTFAILPGANASRLRRFTDLMTLQGFEVYTAASGFDARGKDRLGREFSERKFPAGTLLIPTCQPLAPLLACLLEFDPHMSQQFLNDERRELLRFGRSKMYDVSAWNISMMFDVDGYELATPLPKDASRFSPEPPPSTAHAPESRVGFVIDGADDRCVAAAGRLMERDVRVRVADRPFRFDGRDFARGSVVVTCKDNLNFSGNLAEAAAHTATELGLTVVGIQSGLGAGELPSLGGDHFLLLDPPRIAVVGRDPLDPNAYGEVWYLVDHVLGLRAAYLGARETSWVDLRRYNVLVLPDGGVPAELVETLRSWVQEGRTLIAIGSSAAALTREPGGLGSTRQLPDVLNRLDDYRQTLAREWEGRTVTVDPAPVWSYQPPGKIAYPWLIADGGDKPGVDELKRRDAWQSIFSPHGCILAGRVDDRSWLTAGCGDYVPVYYDGGAVLMASTGVDAPVRLGEIVPATPPTTAPATSQAWASSQPVGKSGWAIAPPGYELRLRMSGLLWPEAAERLANAAYVTREGIGRGQVILFACDPAFRGATLGTMRILANAIVCGPGLGASAPIKP